MSLSRCICVLLATPGHESKTHATSVHNRLCCSARCLPTHKRGGTRLGSSKVLLLLLAILVALLAYLWAARVGPMQMPPSLASSDGGVLQDLASELADPYDVAVETR